ncbi:hypothetical protein M440DRAFT_1390380 [Trichoderma longibrachiatum ATCC 18648]|uniref:C2H2-type domain-containing protein n=1 Tax=Trichoderma longibrachiatum ATCC 18648 TaxID=983965 RepID=A0A2T4CB64_TRILO|nr:hypothetical protein M440DRAFT_1390380 [Trichoderma longibrachiatum ATCC 18648]
MSWMESPQTAHAGVLPTTTTTTTTTRTGSASSASTGTGTAASGYKRASRKGAPRRFVCDHAGCDKIYSRAEHLQRHQLNHNPKEIYRCDVGDCDQKFVRLDLLSRHKKRHTASLHADIVDCQVYAGAKRLLGRKVSSRDYANVIKRMSAWSGMASTRHAILHAFKLLHRVVVDPHPRRRNSPHHHNHHHHNHHHNHPEHQHPAVQYSVRNEPDPHRPWIMYYAVLSIWAFVQALGRPPGKGFPLPTSQLGHSSYARMVEYVSGVAALNELDERASAALHEGLPDLLDVMVDILEEADAELLVEARERLKVCKEMLLGGIPRPGI